MALFLKTCAHNKAWIEINAIKKLAHSGVVGGGVSSFLPYWAKPAAAAASVRPCSTFVLNLLQSTSTSTLCTSISSSCLSSFKFFSFLPPRPMVVPGRVTSGPASRPRPHDTTPPTEHGKFWMNANQTVSRNWFWQDNNIIRIIESRRCDYYFS